ncbi:MAG: aminoglycoside phosphotransferase family protein [Desulfobacterales bacterium]
MNLMTEYLPRVQAYLDTRDWCDAPTMGEQRYTAAPLAQGEYNLNYLVSSPTSDQKLVLRVNIGTQIGRPDQIVYEYRALKLLAGSGLTPRPFFVDDSRELLDRGVLVMAYLPGEPLDYRTDLASASALFAALHQVEVRPADNHLIREDAPLSLIYEECRKLLAHYFDSHLSDAGIRDFLKEVLSWADAARAKEAYFINDPWSCIVNTEVNSGNFIVNRQRGTIHLVDWEMPRWGDPSQDLCHFCSPLTTLWKTDFRMTGGAKKNFIDAYCRGIRDKHLRDTLADRIYLRDPFVYLRGISWSAMGWVTYQTEFSGVKNPDTWQKLQRYMNLAFMRSLFDPFLKP